MEKKVETQMTKDGLRDMADGTIRFTIKTKDTLENMQIHAAFKDFCRVETDNNYTLGLRKLIEYYQSDAKIEMIYHNIQELNVALHDLKSSVVALQSKPKEEPEDDGAF